MLLTLMAITSLSLGPAPAEGLPKAPPAYPDAAHVINGCYISTIAYVARFLADHPREQARPLLVNIRNVDGVTRPHTLALLTWRGQWWGRDEFFGVFPLHRAVGHGIVTDAVIRCAERRLDRHSDDLARDLSLPLPKPPPAHLPANERAHEIAVARELLPFASEQFWIRGENEEIPLLFFRPGPQQIALYDPLSGTAQAEVDSADDARIVVAIAARLGYRVASMRAESRPKAAAE